MEKKYKITQQELEKLQTDLDYLRTVREKEVAEQIKEARAFGDLSENSEYDEAKNEQGKLNSKVLELENILANYEIISDSDTKKGIVTLGCTVKLEDLSDHSSEIYTIVGTREADPINSKISDESPLGKALMGKKVGAKVIYEAPLGTFNYKLISVEK